MSDPLAWLADALVQLDQQGLRRQLRRRDSAQWGDAILLNGQKLLNFGSNDYLGLAAELHPSAAIPAHSGWGAGASPLVTGRSQAHAALEQALAEFEGTEAALLFPTGYAANVGAVTALAGPGDAIFSDARNHASLIDGCRLSGAQIQIYRHCDLDHLAELLGTTPARRKLIVTDSLFSMDGDLAPLAEIAELAESHGAMLLVDEAHATGVLGAHGRGGAEFLGAEHGVQVRVGTLSKALGSLGGFVAGSRLLCDWLANRARTYIFSTACPDPLATAGIQALRCVREEPQRRTELLEGASLMQALLAERGCQIGNAKHQIVPVIVGDPQRAVDCSAALQNRGFLVPAIRPPSVPPGQSLLRISLTWRHTPEMIAALAAAIAEIHSSG